MTPLKAWWRKLAVLTRVARSSGEQVTDRRQLIARIRSLNSTALGASSAEEVVRCWWRMESLAFSYFTNEPRGLDLAGGEIPFEAGPPVHTGFGMAAVLHSELDPARSTELIESGGDPRFNGFAFETLGLMLAAYEQDLFGGLTALAGRLGLLHRPPLKPPKARSVVAGLPAPRLQLAAHGYGRMLYFKTYRFSSALERCRRLRLLPFEGLVRGLTIACALVNCRDLCRVLERCRSDGSDDAEAAVDGGMVDALLFFAWAVPGFLDRLAPRDGRSRELIRAATEQAEGARAQRLGPPLMAWSRG